jgi:hypothetical protein
MISVLDIPVTVYCMVYLKYINNMIMFNVFINISANNADIGAPIASPYCLYTW